MKLWTIQPIRVYEKLMELGKIVGEKDSIDMDFLTAYEWMVQQMEKRIGNRPTSTTFPIWAWYQFQSSTKRKPDLRKSGFLQKGTNGVLLTIEKTVSTVLLSDFILWHYPLTYKAYIGDSEQDANEFEKVLAQQGFNKAPYEKLPNSLKLKIEKSWEKIFELDFDCSYYTQSKIDKSIQASFWELKLSEVIEVEFFIAR